MNIGLIIGVALGVFITTYRHDKMIKEYRKKQSVLKDVKSLTLEKVEKNNQKNEKNGKG